MKEPGPVNRNKGHSCGQAAMTSSGTGKRHSSHRRGECESYAHGGVKVIPNPGGLFGVQMWNWPPASLFNPCEVGGEAAARSPDSGAILEAYPAG